MAISISALPLLRKTLLVVLASIPLVFKNAGANEFQQLLVSNH
jgi:hypothetical protein